MLHPSKFASDRRWSPLSAPAGVVVAVAAADGVVLAVAAVVDGVVLAVAAVADGVAVAALADGVAVAVPVDAVVRPVCPRATRVFSDHGFASARPTNPVRIDPELTAAAFSTELPVDEIALFRRDVYGASFLVCGVVRPRLVPYGAAVVCRDFPAVRSPRCRVISY